MADNSLLLKTELNELEKNVNLLSLSSGTKRWSYSSI